ncbi:hypothetical protein BGW39_004542 [Mortierella sp. 14UC]|nr:hypothetical protein BGW39_004542 [Mortierella sp. 14UC]
MGAQEQQPTTTTATATPSIYSESTLAISEMPEKAFDSASAHGQLDPGPPQLAHQEVVTLPFKELIIVFIGLMLGVFLSSLDQTIVSVCTTKIANEFKALNEVPWVGTAYLLTSTAFQPLYGRFSDIFGRKATFLFAIVVFLVGSALCGASQNMTMMIVSRGLSGVGAGGIMSMVMIIITDLVSLRDRGKYQGIIGAEKVKRIDILGSITLVAGLVLVLLPLNWGGSTYAWNSPIVIGLFCAGFVVLVLFCLIEWKQAAEPIIPFRLFTVRTNVAVFAASFFMGMGFFGVMFFMPLYFQIVRQETATAAGLEMLPLVGGLLISSISSGFMVSKWGKYRPFIWVGFILSTTGIGLLTLLKVDSGRAPQIGFMLIIGLGLGLCMQTMMLAVQSAVATKDIAVATANATFFRTVGSVMGVAIAGTVFNNGVKNNLAPIIALHPEIVKVIADSYLAPTFGPVLEAQILEAYMHAIRSAFVVCVPFMGLGFLSSLFIQHHKLRRAMGPTPME